MPILAIFKLKIAKSYWLESFLKILKLSKGLNLPFIISIYKKKKKTFWRKFV